MADDKRLFANWTVGEGTVNLHPYLSYIVGAVMGCLLAFLLTSVFGMDGTPKLIAFGLMPAICGEGLQRFIERASRSR